MIILLFLVFIFLLFYSVFIRVIVFNPFKTLKYLVIDIVNFFRYRSWNYLECGKLNCYIAHFGGGKTLSAVNYIHHLYNRYNNKRVWDRESKSFVVQKVNVLSNVKILGVPCIPLDSLSQVVDIANHSKDIDAKLHLRTVTLVLIDEASSQLNSRNFKTNINADFLNTLITCRHFNISMYYTSQKFKLTDALLRSVTQQVIMCDKRWRVLIHKIYNADELEVAGDTSLIKPVARSGFFVSNKCFNLYDTFATVEELGKKLDPSDYLSTEEIIAQRGELYNQEVNPKHYSRIKKKHFKK